MSQTNVCECVCERERGGGWGVNVIPLYTRDVYL